MINNFDEIRLILQKYGEDIKRKYVYHYTTGINLKSIIENNQIWLSERNYLNDVLEVEYTKEIIKGVFNNRFKSHTESIIEKIFFEKEMQFIMSTSLEKDSINMWSYYSGSDAYCIEFDRRLLRDYFHKNIGKNIKYFYGPVIYNKTKQRKLLTEVCHKVMDRFSPLANDILNNNIDKINIANYSNAKYVFQYFYSLCKQQGHACEKEFRFLLCNAKPSDYIIKKGLFVPILSVGSKGSIKIPIRRIIIGPNNHEKIAQESLKLFLNDNGYSKVIISHSSLNTR